MLAQLVRSFCNAALKLTAWSQLDRERQRCASYQHELKVVKERNFAVQKQVRNEGPACSASG